MVDHSLALEGVTTLTEEAEVTLEGENLTTQASNDSMSLFIHSLFAFGISGIFVWSALFLTCFQVKNSTNLTS